MPLVYPGRSFRMGRERQKHQAFARKATSGAAVTVPGNGRGSKSPPSHQILETNRCLRQTAIFLCTENTEKNRRFPFVTALELPKNEHPLYRQIKINDLSAFFITPKRSGRTDKTIRGHRFSIKQRYDPFCCPLLKTYRYSRPGTAPLKCYLSKIFNLEKWLFCLISL